MRRWTEREKREVWENITLLSIDEIARLVNRSIRAIYEFIERNNYTLLRRYTENELYIIRNFEVENAAFIITDKTKSGIKVKKWRLKNKSRYKLHKINQSIRLKRKINL